MQGMPGRTLLKLRRSPILTRAQSRRLAASIGLLSLGGFAFLGWVLPFLALLWAPQSASAWRAFVEEFRWDGVILLATRSALEQSLTSTFFSGIFGLLLGVPLGLSVLRARGREARLLSLGTSFLHLPWVIPSLVAATTWTQLLGFRGLNIGYGFWAVVIAHVFYNAPWVAYSVAGATSQISELEIAAAQTLGASRRQVFTQIIWSRVSPAWAVSCLQAFSLCFTSFALVLLLGGGPPVETLETWIYSSVRSQMDSEVRAVAAAWIQAGVGLLLLGLAHGVMPQVSDFLAAKLEPGPRSSRLLFRSPDLWKVLLLLGLCSIWILPYSVVPLHFLMVIYERRLDLELVAGLGSSLFHSVVFSAVVGWLVAWLGGVWVLILRQERIGRGGWLWGQRAASRILWGSLFLLGGLSSLVLSLAWVQWIGFPEGMRAWGVLGLVQVLLLIPVTVRTLWGQLKVPLNFEMDTATSLGATAFKAWGMVEWPRWRGALSSTAFLAWGVSLTEVAALQFFSPPGFRPLPLELSRLLRQYRFEEAELLSVFLFFLSAGLLLIARSTGTLNGSRCR